MGLRTNVGVPELHVHVVAMVVAADFAPREQQHRHQQGKLQVRSRSSHGDPLLHLLQMSSGSLPVIYMRNAVACTLGSAMCCLDGLPFSGRQTGTSVFMREIVIPFQCQIKPETG